MDGWMDGMAREDEVRNGAGGYAYSILENNSFFFVRMSHSRFLPRVKMLIVPQRGMALARFCLPPAARRVAPIARTE